MNIEVHALAYGSMEGTSFGIEAYDTDGNLIAFKSGYDPVKNSNKVYMYVYLLEHFLKQLDIEVNDVHVVVPDGRIKSSRVLHTMALRCEPYINGSISAEAVCFIEVLPSVSRLSKDGMYHRSNIFEQLI